MEIGMYEALELASGLLRLWQGNGDECQVIFGECEGLRRGKARLVAKQGGSGLHPDRDKKLLDGSRRILKSSKGLQTLRDTCLGKVLMVELSNRFSRAKLTQRYHSRDLPQSACLEALAKEETYLEGLGNKFVDKVYGVSSAYGTCDVGRGGWHVAIERMLLKERAESAWISSMQWACYPY